MSESVQLQPDSILHVTSDTETLVWSQGGITDGREESLRKGSDNVGMRILQHSTSAKTIHNYFMGLEQRKCCLLLAACKQSFSSVRLVRSDGRDSGIEEGAMMKSSLGNIDTVTCLDAVEFQVFQLTLKCAAFPVLGAPDPPSEASPVPVVRLGPKRKESGSLLHYNRTMTPLSLVDSGVDEREDTAMVPSETLCELLRRAFRLTQEKFSQYEDIIASQLEKKSPQKILAEELVRQLIALENNENLFYNPKTFVNRIGYDQWQQRERTSLSELLGKFWHFSLPQISDRSIKMSSMHKQYVKLLEKLISYESPYRQQNELMAPPPTTPLSSASVRLLKEFGLRYGVGEQYRKIVYLNYLSMNFDPTIWFIHHVMSSLTSVMESMPTKRSCLVIVKEEYSVLEHCLHLLEVKASAAIAKMKTLFGSKRPQDGVESLIELLSLTLQAKAYLLMSPEEKLGNKLFKIVQSIFPTAYERHKMVAQDELRHNKWETELSPKLLNMLMGSIREEVMDYKQNYQHAFQRYFNITVEAAQEFYKLLMADTSELLNQAKEKSKVLEINRLMLSLTYRLHQLDQDWAVFISPQMQTWRDLLLVEAQHWGVMLKLDMQTLITRVVSLDKYPVCEVQYSGDFQTSAQRDLRERTVSKSLTPSFNSAFTSLSSHNLSPVRHSDDDQKQNKTHKANNFKQDGLPSVHLGRRPSSDPVNISQSSMHSDSYLGDVARSLDHYHNEHLLSFTHIRHSSSLPDFATKDKYIEMFPTSFSGGELKLKTQRDLCMTMGDCRSEERNHSVSPEVCKLTSENAEHNPDSDDSGTITDDSASEDFNFPPLQEVMSSVSVSSIEQAPVITISDITGNHALIQPIAQNVNVNSEQSNIRLSSNTSIPVVPRVIKPLAKPIPKSIVTDSQVPSSPLKTHASIFKDSEIHGGHFSHYQANENSFSDSYNSNNSLPHPTASEESTPKVLPVSSSALDVVIILQRLAGFGNILCRTLAPSRLGYDSDQSAFTSSLEEELPGLPLFNKARQKLYDCFLSAVKGTISVYVDNMLCLDLCGTTQAMASRLAGSRLVEYLRTQQQSGLIWGCRHDLNNRDCFEYLNRRASLLCDRHEPITRQMCSRINNVFMMLSCLERYHHCLGNIFGIHSDLSLRKNKKYFHSSINSVDIIKNEFIIVDGYEYDPSYDRSEVMETASQLCPSQNPDCDSANVVTSPIDSDRDHIMAVLRTLCRIMAYRLNMFVCDALPVLLGLKGVDVPIDVGLKPITDFLSQYFTSLQDWLYQEPYRRMLECLWIFIVQDFEIELSKIERSDNDTESRGQLLLQALAQLLKFMNNQHESLRRELLLSQADDVSFKLSLYAMPLTQLIAIYEGLTRDIGSGSEVSSTDAQYQSVLLVRQRLKHDLQTMKKGFSGTELIQWIVNNQSLFHSFDPALSANNGAFTRETAHVIAQRFLDWNLIADVEGETVRGRSSPLGCSVDENCYPCMTIQDGSALPPVERVSSSNDSTPVVSRRSSPRPYTPKTNLKSSLRALSRQSRATPASKQNEKSQLITSSRSVKNDLDKGHFQRDQIKGQGDFKKGNVQSQFGATGCELDKNKTGKQIDDEDNKLAAIQQEADVTGFGNSVEYASIESEVLGTFDTNSPFINSRMDRASPNFDPYLLRGTPMSLTSANSCDSRSALFFGDCDNFYYVCPYIGDDQDLTWTNCELLHLVEECFQKKITAQYVMRIIYSRRKYDANARAFLKKSPTEMIEKIRFGMPQEEVPRCVSS